MSDWTTKTLGELVSFQKGRKVETCDHPKSGYFEYLGASSLEGAVTAYAESNGAILATSADLLMLWDGERSGLVGKGRGGVVASTMCRLSPGPEVDQGFLLHALQLNYGWIQARRTGTGVPHVPKELANWLQIAYPLEATEQRRIAEVLDTVDEAIRRTEQVIEKLQQMKQGLLHDLLTRGIDDNGELRPPPEEAPHLYKDSPLGLIPSKWEVRSVGSLLNVIEQGWSPDCPSWSAEIGKWGVLRTTAVVWKGYQDKENKALPHPLLPRPEYEVRPRDVLMTRAGPNSRVGVVALVTETQGKLMLSDKLYRLVHRAEVIPDFLVLGLSSATTQRHLSTLKTGLAESQTNISQVIVKTLRFLLPPLPEQERITAMYGMATARSESEALQLSKLRTLKKGLMDDLLTGRVRVNVPEGEC